MLHGASVAMSDAAKRTPELPEFVASKQLVANATRHAPRKQLVAAKQLVARKIVSKATRRSTRGHNSCKRQAQRAQAPRTQSTQRPDGWEEEIAKGRAAVAPS